MLGLPVRGGASGSYGNRRPDCCVRDVIVQPEILVAEGEQILDLRVDPHRRQRLGRPAKLLARLFEMIRIKMRITQRMDEIAGLEPGYLRYHHRQQGIGSDVEGHAKEDVARAL